MFPKHVAKDVLQRFSQVEPEVLKELLKVSKKWEPLWAHIKPGMLEFIDETAAKEKIVHSFKDRASYCAIQTTLFDRLEKADDDAYWMEELRKARIKRFPADKLAKIANAKYDGNDIKIQENDGTNITFHNCVLGT